MYQNNTQLLSPESVSDEQLVTQSLAGDHAAFEALVHSYDTGLFGYIRSVLGHNGDDEQAHDVLQFVLLQFYLSLPTLSTRRSLKPWLFRVAYNRCVDELRVRRRQRVIHFSELEGGGNQEESSLMSLIQDPRPLPEEVVEHDDTTQELRHAIQELPLTYRSVVLLRCLYEMSFREIAQTLKMPDATVKTYFYRARPHLRAALTRSFYPISALSST